MDEKRVFIDRQGLRWTVTEVQPEHGAPPLRERRKFPRMSKRQTAEGPALATRQLTLPWLRFDSRNDARVFEPAPSGWAALPDELLEDLLGRTVRLKGR